MDGTLTGSTGKMHPDQLAIDAALVGRMLTDQFPEWADLPLSPVRSDGTENAIYRLGDALSVRLPYRAAKTSQIDKDHRWLPGFAPRLPLPIPVPVAKGAPAPGYPCQWSVCRWVPGNRATLDRFEDPRRAAEDLAGFIHALQDIDAHGGPAPGEHNFWRGVPLAARDGYTRKAISALDGEVDVAAVTEAWDRDLRAPTWDAAPVWLHGDLAPGNLVARDGRLAGVIDWGGLGVGDPATELQPAWNLFRGESRSAFREALAIDDATWARGRGLTLSVALVALPYYLETNPAIVRGSRVVIDEILDDLGLP